MVGSEDIKDFNFKTGKIVTVNQQSIKTPSSTFTASKIIMDETGIYEYGGKKFAANLLDEKESEINVLSKFDNEEQRESILERESQEHDFNLEVPILLIAFIMMMTEFFYIKRRGDI